MKTLKVQNFKSIFDSGDIELKPITVFLGKNGCGKSSFLRILPLLKQSLELNRIEPLLWYGPYVDFGEYGTIVPFLAKNDNEVTFEFSIDSDRFIRRNRLFEENYFLRETQTINFYVKFTIKDNRMHFVEIKYYDQKVSIEFGTNENILDFYVNDLKIDYINSMKYFESYNKGSLFPRIFGYKDNIYVDFYSYGIDNFLSLGLSSMKRKISKASFRDFIGFYRTLFTKEQFLKILTRKTNSKTISSLFEDLSIDSELFQKLNAYYVASQLPIIFDQVSACVESYCDNLYYIKPIRASADRYYRKQGINVKNINSDGDNVAMVLNSLKQSELESFSGWCYRFLKVRFSVENQGAMVSIKVVGNNGIETNLADTGYGYSQILPILLQMWMLNREAHIRRTMIPYTLVIEQPELHLHPAFQAKFADIIVDLVKNFLNLRIRINLIIETHSDFLLNELSFNVSSLKIKPDLLNVVLAEKNDSITKFTQTSFSSNGYLENWPSGFMAPDQYDY